MPTGQIAANLGSMSTYNPHSMGSVQITLPDDLFDFNQDVYFAESWREIEAAIDAIFDDKPIPSSQQKIYNSIEIICTSLLGAQLYDKVTKACRSHLSVKKERLLADCSRERYDSEEDASIGLARTVLGCWAQWSCQMREVEHMVLPLDQYYAASALCTLISDLAVVAWAETVNPDLEQRGIYEAAIRETSKRARSGDADSIKYLEDFAAMCHAIPGYSDIFEGLYMGTARVDLGNWYQDSLSSLKAGAFSRAVMDIIQTETERLDKLKMSQKMHWNFSRMFDEILIRPHKEMMTEAEEIHRLYDVDDFDALRNTFNILGRINHSSAMIQVVSSWIERVGNWAIESAKLDSQNTTILTLIGLMKKIDKSWEYCFNKNLTMASQISDSYSSVINRRATTSSGHALPHVIPELFAKYLDFLLKGKIPNFPTRIATTANGGVLFDEPPKPEKENVSKEETMRFIREAFDSFRYLQTKILVEPHYRRDFGRRLLNNRYVDMKLEEYAIHRFEGESGESFTEAMTLMLRDLKESRAQAEASSRRNSKWRPDALNFTSLILSSLVWPAYPEDPVRVPNQIKVLQEEALKNYRKKHPKRSLDWKIALSNCLIKANFPLGAKELAVSGFQGLVLMLFSDLEPDEKLSYSQIQAGTEMSDSELKRTLLSLASAKVRPLTKYPRGREVKTTDMFSINAGFTHDSTRIKISQIQLLDEAKEEADLDGDENVKGELNNDQIATVQASMMKVLKVKKIMSREDLVRETLARVAERAKLVIEDENQVSKVVDKLYSQDYIGKDIDGLFTWDLDL